MQGILGGLVTALGYLLGQVIALLWRALDMPGLPSRLAKSITLFASALIAIFFIWVLSSSLTWQNDLREKMGVAPADALNLFRIVVFAALTFAFAFALGRLIASFFRAVRARLYRVMPPRRANVVGLILVGLILVVVTRDGILDRVISGLDTSYETAQALFENAPPLPTNPQKPAAMRP